MTALSAAALSPVERKLAAYGKQGGLSRTLSRVIAAFRPLQMVSLKFPSVKLSTTISALLVIAQLVIAAFRPLQMVRYCLAS